MCTNSKGLLVRWAVISGAALLLNGNGVVAVWGQQAAERSAPKQREQRERGRYLVHQVAMCVQCHTPRTREGMLIEERLLEGARLPVLAPYRDQPWALQAPSLAGLPGWQREEFIALLVRGRRPDQSPPRPPMPPFRMSEEDARAIAVYLNSLVP